MLPCLALTLLLQQAAARSPARVAGEVGRAVLLAADAGPGFQHRDVIWRWLAAREELVATYFRGSAETLYQSRFRGRSRLHANLSLEILSLELGDSGTFSALLVDARGRTETRVLQLTVHEAVTEVTVEVFMSSQRRAGSAEPCEAFLRCTAAGGTAVTYSWARSGGQAPGTDGRVLGEAGRVLQASLAPAERHVAFTCTAANAVSRATAAAVLPWEHCRRAGLAEASCHYGDVLLLAAPLLVLAAAAAAIAAAMACAHHRCCRRRAGRCLLPARHPWVLLGCSGATAALSLRREARAGAAGRQPRRRARRRLGRRLKRGRKALSVLPKGGSVRAELHSRGLIRNSRKINGKAETRSEALSCPVETLGGGRFCLAAVLALPPQASGTGARRKREQAPPELGHERSSVVTPLRGSRQQCRIPGDPAQAKGRSAPVGRPAAAADISQPPAALTGNGPPARRPDEAPQGRRPPALRMEGALG
ncbi:SLAM family member 8 [Apteryx mantelli]|uniref:SLAM family member 8 n=1 Tax=Apteryx mantelli TaxID=2696672 RepID=A0ABM4FWE1_9AVES